MTDKMKFFDAPPLRYFGAKWQLADWIISNMPPHTLYCEPFCGGAAVFFRKRPAPLNVLNDINGDVVNFFRVLRERRDELIELIDLTPWSRDEYENALETNASDPLERARQFYVIAYQSFVGGGTGDKKTGWRHQIDWKRGTAVTGEWSRLSGLRKAADLLKHAQIENDHAHRIIARYDSAKTLFYVDPPYVIRARARGIGRYSYEMDEQQHRELAIKLKSVTGYVLLSGYRSELYEELYDGWTRLEKSTTTSGNSVATEYLWLSPSASNVTALPLFGQ